MRAVLGQRAPIGSSELGVEAGGSADIRHRPPFFRNAPPLIRNLAVADGTQANPERSPVIRLRTFSPHADRALTGCPAKVHSSGQKARTSPSRTAHCLCRPEPVEG